MYNYERYRFQTYCVKNITVVNGAILFHGLLSKGRNHYCDVARVTTRFNRGSVKVKQLGTTFNIRAG